MSVIMMSVVVGFLVVSAWTVLGIHNFRSARRRRAEQAGWAGFRRCHADLDRELDRIWNRR